MSVFDCLKTVSKLMSVFDCLKTVSKIMFQFNFRTCSCGLEDQTPDHLLQNCPLLKTLRDINLANSNSSVYQTIYGSKQDLEVTALFVSLSGLAL
jgi:hypothetical protein